MHGNNSTPPNQLPSCFMASRITVSTQFKLIRFTSSLAVTLIVVVAVAVRTLAVVVFV